MKILRREIEWLKWAYTQCYLNMLRSDFRRLSFLVPRGQLATFRSLSFLRIETEEKNWDAYLWIATKIRSILNVSAAFRFTKLTYPRTADRGARVALVSARDDFSKQRRRDSAEWRPIYGLSRTACPTIGKKWPLASGMDPHRLVNWVAESWGAIAHATVRLLGLINEIHCYKSRSKANCKRFSLTGPQQCPRFLVNLVFGLQVVCVHP